MNENPFVVEPYSLKSAFGDGEGNLSIGRLIAFIVVMCCVVMPVLLWFWLSCLKGQLLEIPGSVIGFMGAAGTLAASLYAITKNAEKAPVPPVP